MGKTWGEKTLLGSSPGPGSGIASGSGPAGSPKDEATSRSPAPRDGAHADVAPVAPPARTRASAPAVGGLSAPRLRNHHAVSGTGSSGRTRTRALAVAGLGLSFV